jgi:predicted  nucleic acid-binding Zn-ribbon protein
MLKNIIAPVQAWLLSRGQCVGCGMSLKKAKKKSTKGGNTKVVCKCGRIFIYNKKSGKYRRALFEEV